MTFGAEGTEGTYVRAFSGDQPCPHELLPLEKPACTTPRMSQPFSMSSRLTVITRYASLPGSQRLIRTVRQLDCARTYAAGTSEEILGDVGWRERGLVMGTKLYPTAVRRHVHFTDKSTQPLCIRRADVKSAQVVRKSLTALRTCGSISMSRSRP